MPSLVLLPRRRFLKVAGGVVAGAALTAAPAPGLVGPPGSRGSKKAFQISLAEWSLHRQLRASALDHLDFARVAKQRFGILAVEYVNSFFKDRAGDFGYLGEMKARAEAEGVRSLLIMIDGEGSLAQSDDAGRRQAVENHFRWIAAACFLGCHSIRVNAGGDGDPDLQAARAADSLTRLARVAEPYEINVIVENHGGLSSNGAWLADVMRRADHPRVGTLPDFGNFHLGDGKWYDRYQGVAELMPFAKAVSAKSHEFDDQGNEKQTDFARMMRIVLDAGYHGYVGIEYEGSAHSEDQGILKTKALLEKLRDLESP